MSIRQTRALFASIFGLIVWIQPGAAQLTVFPPSGTTDNFPGLAGGSGWTSDPTTALNWSIKSGSLVYQIDDATSPRNTLKLGLGAPTIADPKFDSRFWVLEFNVKYSRFLDGPQRSSCFSVHFLGQDSNVAYKAAWCRSQTGGGTDSLSAQILDVKKNMVLDECKTKNACPAPTGASFKVRISRNGNQVEMDLLQGANAQPMATETIQDLGPTQVAVIDGTTNTGPQPPPATPPAAQTFTLCDGSTTQAQGASNCLGVATYDYATVDRFPQISLRTVDSNANVLALSFTYLASASQCTGQCSNVPIALGTALTPCVNAASVPGDQDRKWTPPAKWNGSLGDPNNCGGTYTVMGDDTLTATMSAQFHLTGTVKPDTGGNTATYTSLPNGCSVGSSTFDCYVDPGNYKVCVNRKDGFRFARWESPPSSTFTVADPQYCVNFGVSAATTVAADFDCDFRLSDDSVGPLDRRFPISQRVLTFASTNAPPIAISKVVTGPGCAWGLFAAPPNPPPTPPDPPPTWISGVGVSQIGPVGQTPVSFPVSNNSSGQKRSASLQVALRDPPAFGVTAIAPVPVQANQSGSGCTILLKGETDLTFVPTTALYLDFAGKNNIPYQIQVSPSSDCVWNAVRSDPWLLLSANANVGSVSGAGNGTFTFSVAANDTSFSRTGVIAFTGGASITIVESGKTCEGAYTLDAPTVTYPSTRVVGASVTVTAPSACTYSSRSDSSFITNVHSPTSGTGQVTFDIDANTSGVTRSGVVVIAGNSFTVNQLATNNPLNCTVTATSMPNVRTEGRTEPVSDVNLTCSAPVVNLITKATVSVTLNRSITSTLLDTKSPNLAAQLKVTKPSPAVTYQGRLVGHDTVVFDNVFLAPTVEMTISNVLVDASIQPAGSAQSQLANASSIQARVAMTAPDLIVNMQQAGNPATFTQTGWFDVAMASTVLKNPLQVFTSPPVSIQGQTYLVKAVTFQLNRGDFETKKDAQLALQVRLDNGAPLPDGVVARASAFNWSGDPNNNVFTLLDGTTTVPGIKDQNGNDLSIGVTTLTPSNWAFWQLKANATPDQAALVANGITFIVVVAVPSGFQDNLKFYGALAPFGIPKQSGVPTVDPTPRFRDLTTPPERQTNLRISGKVGPTSDEAAMPVFLSEKGGERYVASGSSVPLVYHILNDSDTDATNVSVATIPVGLQITSCQTSAGVTCQQNPAGEVSLGQVNRREAVDVTIGTVVDPTLPEGTILGANGSTRATLPDSDPFSNRTSLSLIVTADCRIRLAASVVSMASYGDQGKLLVVTGPTCNYPVTTQGSWLHLNTAATLKGPAVISYKVDANPGPGSRLATITIGDATFQVFQAAPGCTFSITGPAQGKVPSNGGPFSITVAATPATCGWVAASSATWLTFDGAAEGPGTKILNLTATQNNGITPRTAAITVGGASLQLIQTVPSQLFAPPFNDVGSTYVYTDFISMLSQFGLLSGFAQTMCADGKQGLKLFCPDDVILRKDVAVLLVRALVGDTFPLPPAKVTDINPSDWRYPYVQKLYDMGITQGCGVNPIRYCGETPIKRWEMAVLLMRAKLGLKAGDLFTSYLVDPPYFTDVPPSHVAYPFVQKLRELNITSGCGPALFCAENSTTRGQMSVFVVRSFYSQ